MITRLFVDASVLAFPPQVDNMREDCENIMRFLRNLNKLILIWKDIPNIAISIKNGIGDDLKKKRCDFNYAPDQKKRIEYIKNYDPEFEIVPRDIARDIDKILVSNKEEPYRFDNNYTIKDIDNNNLQKYHESASVCRDAFFEGEYKKLIAYVSDLNKKYKTDTSCCIAICGKGQNQYENTVAITRVRKVYEHYKNSNPDFETLEAAYNKAKEETAENLFFSDDIKNNSNVSIVHNSAYNKQPIPNKIYHYLTTLAEVAKKNDFSEISDEKTINKVVRIFGCNSTEEHNNNYQNCPHRRWHDGKNDSQFHLHLRPTTTPPNIPGTTRIYYKYDNEQKKMVVGMILEHPPNCGKCPDEDRCLGMNTIGSIIKQKR